MTRLVGLPAPQFTATAVVDQEFKEVSLSHYRGKYVVLFFYPLDFTFVCPTEILAFDHRLDELKERNVEVIGVSVDSQFSHLAWKSTPVEKGGLGPVRFPLVADLSKSIARDYDVLVGDVVALRGTFLIDKDGVVQHQVVNNLGLGRNIDEAIRMVDALQVTEKHGEVCPAGWNKGKAGMKASTSGVAEYLAAHAKEL
jgi:peroxiredoxin (alkyl hydroperoxide reductase subunit C)